MFRLASIPSSSLYRFTNRLNLSGYALNTGFRYYPKNISTVATKETSVVLKSSHEQITSHIQRYKSITDKTFQVYIQCKSRFQLI